MVLWCSYTALFCIHRSRSRSPQQGHTIAKLPNFIQSATTTYWAKILFSNEFTCRLIPPIPISRPKYFEFILRTRNAYISESQVTASLNRLPIPLRASSSYCIQSLNDDQSAFGLSRYSDVIERLILHAAACICFLTMRGSKKHSLQLII